MSERSEQSDAIFDKDALLNTIGNNKELMVKLIKIYTEKLPDLLSRIQDAIAREDRESLKISAHTLRGMSLNMFGHGVAMVTWALEEMGEMGNLSHAEKTCATLEIELRHLKTALKPHTEEKQ